MREIKFRAWDGDKMYEPFTLQMGLSMTEMALRLNPPGWLFHKKNIYMQFTGLLDKNNVEIFEGDILKTPAGHIISISFGEKVYRFGRDEVQCFGWIATKISNGHKETLDDSMTPGEVIGNIHSNPELLTDKQKQ